VKIDIFFPCLPSFDRKTDKLYFILNALSIAPLFLVIRKS
jgi:hypothetical protein